MLERLWLILIFVLAGFVPPMHAAQKVPAPAVQMHAPCTMACCAGGCMCEDCPCASERPSELPTDQEPAVPATEREQKRTSEPRFDFVDLVLPDLGGPLSLGRAIDTPVAFGGADRPESLLCVWRI
jgi:hypothetical protein